MTGFNPTWISGCFKYGIWNTQQNNETNCDTMYILKYGNSQENMLNFNFGYEKNGLLFIILYDRINGSVKHVTKKELLKYGTNNFS